ncbi:hypothetical protein [Pedobacter sp. N23S346]|uniref:hypothetical protein n=1 Tax=Pedobacter sp. N23S346 TaxID=3402750 RepID=UPI003ACD50CD
MKYLKVGAKFQRLFLPSSPMPDNRVEIVGANCRVRKMVLSFALSLPGKGAIRRIGAFSPSIISYARSRGIEQSANPGMK